MPNGPNVKQNWNSLAKQVPRRGKATGLSLRRGDTGIPTIRRSVCRSGDKYTLLGF